MIRKQIIGTVLMMLTIAPARTDAQNGEMADVFGDFEARAANGTPRDVADAEPALEHLGQVSKENIVEVLPLILRETRNPQLSVRRLAATALYQVTTRPDGRALLSTETTTFAALLTDADIPIRRISMLAVHNLRLNASSPLVPVLETYLVREDAVSTIGAGVAIALMEVAPNDADSTAAVIQYMKRKDQTSSSRGVLLNAIWHVAKSHNREIGKEVAAYADDPDEQTSLLAIETLQQMGKSTISDNQQSLSRIASDTGKSRSVRAAATKALALVQ